MAVSVYGLMQTGLYCVSPWLYTAMFEVSSYTTAVARQRLMNGDRGSISFAAVCAEIS
jgi:hypothetical protein